MRDRDCTGIRVDCGNTRTNCGGIRVDCANTRLDCGGVKMDCCNTNVDCGGYNDMADLLVDNISNFYSYLRFILSIPFIIIRYYTNFVVN